MSNPTWPDTLPPPLSSGTTIEPSFDNVLATSMEAGPSKRRRRTTWVPDKFTTSVSLDGAQVQILRTFVETTLSDVLPFDWVDPVTQDTKTYVFTQRPTYSADDGMYDSWTAQLVLESKP